MKARVVLACALALGGLTPPAARAQDAQTLEGEETDELRALRLAELEVFSETQPLVDLGSVLSAPSVVPSALTSDAPELTPSVGATGTARDLS